MKLHCLHACKLQKRLITPPHRRKKITHVSALRLRKKSLRVSLRGAERRGNLVFSTTYNGRDCFTSFAMTVFSDFLQNHQCLTLSINIHLGDFRTVVLRESSFSCASLTGEGASVITQVAFCVLGKAMTSRMDSAPVRSIINRSRPRAIPP